jgi:hypothetical protein
MKHSFIAVAAGIAAFTGLIFAQNARINSLGNCEIIDDIGVVGSLPVYMNDYPDVIQATAFKAAFGQIVGIKSVGDMIRIGAIANQGGVLKSNFYGRGADIVNQVANPDLPAAGGFPPIPHLLFGINLPTVKLGFDGFLEYASSKLQSETDVAGVKATAETKGRIYNGGLVANALINLGDISIMPLIGVGIPRISGLEETVAPNNTITTERSSESGLFLRAGIQLGLPLAGLDWLVGGIYQMEKYQFASTTAAKTTKTPEYLANFFYGYIGFTGDILDKVLIVTRYGIDLGFDNTETTTILPPPDTTQTLVANFTAVNVKNTFGLGLERPIENFLFFDALTPRAGLDLRVNRAIVKTDGVNSLTTTKTEAKARNPYSTIVTPTFGLGVTKGRAAIDVGINIGDWGGVVSGPTVFIGTVTLDFGKQGAAFGTFYAPEEKPSPKDLKAARVVKAAK